MESDLIVVAKVVDFSTSEDRGLITKVEILEHLKGRAKSRTVEAWVPLPMDALADLKRRNAHLLLFMNNERMNAFHYVVSDEDSLAPLEDFTFLKGGLNISTRVRELIKAQERTEPLGSFVIPVPEDEREAVWLDQLSRSGLGYSMIAGLAVPVDERLERWAYDHLDPKDRRNFPKAVAALTYFRSKRAVTALRELLKSNETEIISSRNGILQRRFFARQLASDQLKKWGETVGEVIFEETGDAYDTIEEVYWDGDAGREQLGVLRKFKKLRKLWLFSKQLGYEELSLIATVPTLIELDLGNSKIKDGDLAALASSESLTILNLANVPITDASIEDLSRIKSLRQIWVAGTEISEDGLESLAQKRPDLKVLGTENLNAIIRYAAIGDIAGVQRVLKRDPSMIGVRDGQGYSVLHAAVGSRSYDMVKLCVDAGAEIDALDSKNRTPLGIAASYHNMDFRIAFLLLSSGANANHADVDGNTVLHHASYSSAQLVGLLLNTGSDLEAKNDARQRPFEPSRSYLSGIKELWESFLKARDEVPAIVPNTPTNCPNVVYETTPGDLTRWTNEKVGAFTGDLQWSKAPGERNYFGPFGQQKVSLAMSDLKPHQHVTVEVEFWAIGSWDGNGDGNGPDIFSISVPGVGTLMHSSFYNNSGNHLKFQSFPDPYLKGFHRGGTGSAEFHTLKLNESDVRDAVYKLVFTFEHKGADFRLDFQGLTVPQGGLGNMLFDEHWGLGKVTVRTD